MWTQSWNGCVCVEEVASGGLQVQTPQRRVQPQRRTEQGLGPARWKTSTPRNVRTSSGVIIQHFSILSLYIRYEHQRPLPCTCSQFATPCHHHCLCHCHHHVSPSLSPPINLSIQIPPDNLNLSYTPRNTFFKEHHLDFSKEHFSPFTVKIKEMRFVSIPLGYQTSILRHGLIEDCYINTNRVLGEYWGSPVCLPPWMGGPGGLAGLSRAFSDILMHVAVPGDPNPPNPLPTSRPSTDGPYMCACFVPLPTAKQIHQFAKTCFLFQLSTQQLSNRPWPIWWERQIVLRYIWTIS